MLGDWNDYEHAEPLLVASADGAPLVNLTTTLPEDERYTYVYRGNSQALDHICVTPNLALGAEYDVVHVNCEFASAASDHDPVVARLDVR